MVIEEVLQRIESLYSKGVPSKDSRLTRRQIYNGLLTARSTVLSSQSNRKNTISQFSYQILPCVEMIDANIHECPCTPDIVEKIKRTRYMIPKLISDNTGMLIQSVTNLDGTVSFDETDFDTMKFETGNKFTAKKKKYFIRNGYLYTTNTNLMEFGSITISGLFENPVEAYTYPTTCFEVTAPACLPCLDYNKLEFPVDQKLLESILSFIKKEFVILFPQMKEDKAANANDDNNIGGQMIHE